MPMYSSSYTENMEILVSKLLVVEVVGSVARPGETKYNLKMSH